MRTVSAFIYRFDAKEEIFLCGLRSFVSGDDPAGKSKHLPRRRSRFVCYSLACPPEDNRSESSQCKDCESNTKYGERNEKFAYVRRAETKRYDRDD